MRSRHCDVCDGWHDLEKPWPDNCKWHGHKREGEDKIGLQIVKDIEPYKAIGLPGAPVITSKRHHRDAMRAHGMVEVGNTPVTKQYEAAPGFREDMKRALWDVERSL